jgi:hypothetical protein
MEMVKCLKRTPEVSFLVDLIHGQIKSETYEYGGHKWADKPQEW